MTHHLPHHLKRLQHGANTDLHSYHSHQSNTSLTNPPHHPSRLSSDEAIRESMQAFTVSASHTTKLSRPFKPGPHQARRGGGGGGGGRPRDRHWVSSLPKRAINYDLAESFMDHSTNPLSSDLYKIKFKHSAKQWPNGRFTNYKEKLDKLDGNIIDITCTRTFPIVHKRKKIPETKQNERNDQLNVPSTAVMGATSLLTFLDPVAQEEKKKQADKQTNVYANLFGIGKIPRLSSTTQVKKTNVPLNLTSSTASVSLLDENTQDHQS